MSSKCKDIWCASIAQDREFTARKEMINCSLIDFTIYGCEKLFN